ncbi:MAG TPA: hypothetical protein VF837_05560 [Patescibacteria group bacterium]
MEILGLILILLAVLILNGATIVRNMDGANRLTAFLNELDPRVFFFTALAVGFAGIALSLSHICFGW